MKLTDLELQQYQELYERIVEKPNIVLTERFCFKFIINGTGINPNSAKQIWSECSNKKEKLSKEDFFKLLKYVSALQNGIPFEEITLDEEGLEKPYFPKFRNNIVDIIGFFE